MASPKSKPFDMSLDGLEEAIVNLKCPDFGRYLGLQLCPGSGLSNSPQLGPRTIKELMNTAVRVH
jgi:hypothetical protein